MSKIVIPTQEFEPVSTTILGAIDGISKELQGAPNKFKSNYNGESFIVCSYEKPVHPNFSLFLRKKFYGFVSVSFAGMESTDTILSYVSRYRDRAVLHEAETAPGAVADPYEFAQIVKSADYSQALDLYTSMAPSEEEETRRKHGSVIAMAEEIIDKEGANIPVPPRENGKNIRIGRTVEIDCGIRLQILKRLADSEGSEILSIWTNELTADGSRLEKAYVCTDDGFIELILTDIEGRETTEDEDFLLISDEDLKRLYRIFESQL